MISNSDHWAAQARLSQLHQDASRARLVRQLRAQSVSRHWLSRLLDRLMHRQPRPAAA
ncbi:hypothetical protein [Deinococcus alpinitundrae]|uniref:hypothetical protein n=1 Tax=Deinococcus alpinitundrae TaxID=468913 RepID=UPI001379B1C4|nr:hypothetical protein [Deinococcus alpinitundrae]